MMEMLGRRNRCTIADTEILTAREAIRMAVDASGWTRRKVDSTIH